MGRKLKDTYHRLGELLVRKGHASAHHIDEALALQRAHANERKAAPKLGDILIDRKVLTANVIKEILEEQKVARGEKRVLTVGLRDHGDVAIVELVGRLDESKQDHVTKVFERLMNRGFCRIAVDCSKLVYLDSHGVSAFVAYVDEARARGGDVKFFKMNPDAKFTLERLGLSKFLQTFPNEDASAKAFDLPIDEYMSRGTLGEYVSRHDQKVFHLSYCPVLSDVHDEDKVYFESKKHARDAGKSPCRKCKP